MNKKIKSDKNGFVFSTDPNFKFEMESMIKNCFLLYSVVMTVHGMS